ncbi:MAG: two component transcriptional regulator, LuxR family [Thermoleophilia bacterium]|nr:two component transcriptional regulator, LuxR family [Thermoleophilia bacterium]
MNMPQNSTCAIVDDHEVVREGIRLRLEATDWIEMVGEASSCTSAGELIRRTRPSLVLMDIRLPDGDGAQLAAELGAEGLGTRFVLYSGSATTAQAEQALEAGVFGFVLKDSPVGMVLDALTAARDGRRYIDPTIAADMMSPSGGRPLSPRELEILALMADGGQNASIAFQLGISAETVKAHVSNILAKCEADSRTHAVAKALREGIIR